MHGLPSIYFLLLILQERSLATISYLMSLTGMARVPFSLVDEINQGMDQRAERNVHNQLVDVTCASDAGQWVLSFVFEFRAISSNCGDVGC